MTSCLISFAWDQPIFHEHVESDEIQNEKVLPTVGLEPTTLRFKVWISSDLACTACWNLFIYMTVLHTCTPETNVYIVISTRMVKESVFCLVNVLFCATYWNIYLYYTNSKETHDAFVCFQHANMTKHSTLPGIMRLLLFAQYRYIPIGNTKQYTNKTNYAPLHSRTYNNVNICTGSTCML